MVKILNNTQPTKAILFARVSSREQEQGASIDAQIHNIERYCESKNLTIMPTRFVITESSTKGDRPIFVKMLQFARNQKSPVAIVADCVDRIQRSFRESIELGDLCNNGKIELHFIRENLIINKDSNSSETMRWDFGVMAAKTYVGNLRDNVKRSFKEIRENGRWTHKAPVGYQNIRVNGKAQVVIDSEQAPKVQQLFEEYAYGGQSLDSLVKMAERNGLRYKLDSTRQNAISRSGIARILKNPFYIGIMRINGVDYPHQHGAIISRQLFNLVQDRLNNRCTHPTKGTYGTEPYAFRGIMRCKCGYSMTPTHIVKKSNGKRYDYLFCPHCEQKPLSQADLFLQLKEEIFDPMNIPTALLTELKTKVRKALEKDNETQLAIGKRIKSQISDIEQRTKRATTLLLDGDIDKETYNQIKTENKNKLTELKEQMTSYDKIDQDIAETVDLTFSIAGNVSKIFPSLNSGEKNELLRLLILNCEPENKKARISLQKPFCFFLENPGCTSWLPIFTELRTTYYDAIMNLKPQLQDIAEVLNLPLQPYKSARAAAV